MSGSPSGLAMPWATSMRKPSTPRSSQNRIVCSRSATTSGFAKFRSGCSGANMCRYHWPSGTRVHAGPPKTDGQLFGGSLPSGPRPVPEQVARPLGRAGRRGQRRPEPLVVVRAVVGHQVDGHPDAQAVGVGEQRVELGQVAEHRLDVARVGDVVAVVGHRGGVERRDPQRVDAEVGEVGQPAADAGQVADAVAVAVGEAADVDLVEDGVPPPAAGGGRRVGAARAPRGRSGAGAIG